MVVGPELTYTEARAPAFPNGLPKKCYLKTTPLREALNRLGIKTGNQLIALRRKRPRSQVNFSFDAILKVNADEDGRHWHWIVWDATRKKYLEPEDPPCRRPRVASYLRIYG